MQNLLDRGLSKLIVILSIFMVTYHLLYTQILLLGPIQHLNLHYMLALLMVFLYAMVAALLVIEKTDGVLSASPHTADGTFVTIADAQASEEVARVFAGRYGLSPREQDVLLLLLAGRTRAEVGTETGLADGTVRTHVTNIYKKVDVHSREELVKRFETFENKALSASFDKRLE